MAKQGTGQPYRKWAQPQPTSSGGRWSGIVTLSLMLAVGIGGFVWWALRPPRRSLTLVTSLIVPKYNESILASPAYAQANAKRLAEHAAAQSISNWRATPSVELQDDSAWRQAIDQLEQELSASDQRVDDTVLLYVRAHAAVIDGTAYLLASNFSGAQGSGRVPLEDLLKRLQQLKARDLLVVLDTSDLELDLHLDLLVNAFPRQIEPLSRELADQPRLWIVTAAAMLQPSHVAYQLPNQPDRHATTLLHAALMQATTKKANAVGDDQQLTLAEVYEHLLRYCYTATGGQQTPLLFRSGVGLCDQSSEPAKRAWNEAQQVILADLDESPTELLERAEDAKQPAATQAAPSPAATTMRDTIAAEAIVAREVPSRIDIHRVVYQAVPTNPASPSEPTVAPVTTNPAASPTASPDTGAATADATSSAPAIDPNPYWAAWQWIEKLKRRDTAYGWSPADFAPHHWREVQQRLLLLQRRQRVLDEPVDAELTRIAGNLERLWQNMNGQFPPPPLGSRDDPDRELFEAWQNFSQQSPWNERKMRWEAKHLDDPNAPGLWPLTERACRRYADATVEIESWISLVQEFDEGVRAVDGVLDLLVDLRETVAQLESDASAVDGDRLRRFDAIDEARRACDQLLADWIAAVIKPPQVDWSSERRASVLLESPVLSVAQRRQLIDWLDGRAINEPGISSPLNTDISLASMLLATDKNQGSDSRWALRRAWASLVAKGLRLIASDVPQPDSALSSDDASAFNQWAARYHRAYAEAARTASPEASILRWLQASLIRQSDATASGFIPGQAVASIVVAPAANAVLQASVVGPKRLRPARVGIATPLSVQLSYSDASPPPNQCFVRIGNTNPAATKEQFSIRCQGGELPWNEFVGRPCENGALTLEVVSKIDQSTVQAASVIQISVKDRVDAEPSPAIPFSLEPPFPYHVDLYATWEDRRDFLLRATSGVGNAVPRPIEHLSELDGLMVPLFENASGRYRMWLTNRSQEAMRVRAQLFAVSQPPGMQLRRGSVVGYLEKGVPAVLADWMTNQIRAGRVKALASATLDLPPANRADAIFTSASDEFVQQARPIAFAAGAPGAPPADPAVPIPATDCSRGLMVYLEPVDAEGKPLGGATWQKWMDVTPMNPLTVKQHPQLRQRPELGGILDPLEIRWAAGRPLSIRARVKPYLLTFYGLEGVPLSLSASLPGTLDSVRALELSGRGKAMLNAAIPEATLEVQPAPGTFDPGRDDLQMHVTVGEYADLENFQIRSSQPPQRDVTFAFLEQVQAFAEGIEQPIVLREFQGKRVVPAALTVQGALTPVRYQALAVTARFGAHANAFLTPETDGPKDRIALRLRRVEGEILLDEKVHLDAVHRIDSQVSLSPEGWLKLQTQRSPFVERFESPLRDEGDYAVEAAIELTQGRSAVAKQTLLVDRSAPEATSIELTTADDRSILYLGEACMVRLPVADRYTEVESVEFRIDTNADGRFDESDAKLNAPVLRDANGDRKTSIKGDDLIAFLPGRLQVVARSTDLAGNLQTGHTPASFVFAGGPRPPPANKAAMANAPKLHQVTIVVTRDGKAPNKEPELTGMPGKLLSKGGGRFVYGEVPEGEYTVTSSIAIQFSGTYEAEAKVRVPGQNVVTLELKPQK